MTKAALTLASFGIAACLAGASAGARSDHPPAPAWMSSAVTASAASLGEQSPTIVWVRLGRYPKVIFTGQFVCNSCPRPPGAASPSGTVASLRFDGLTHRVTDFGLSSTPFSPPACGIDCPLPKGTVLDSALDALRRSSRGENPFGIAVGWRHCSIRLPTPDYRVVDGRCLTRIFHGSRRNIVVFVQRWHGRGPDGRRATGPILEHRWRVVEDGQGWVLTIQSSGATPPQRPH